MRERKMGCLVPGIVFQIANAYIYELKCAQYQRQHYKCGNDDWVKWQ